MYNIRELVLNQIDNKEFFVWDAIVAWRDCIYQSNFYNNTKGNYLTNMLKLIESDIVNVNAKLSEINECWLEKSKQKIESNLEWSKATKTIRKSCLSSFYKFIQTDFDKTITPYRRHPKPLEIKHILSSVQDKALTTDISPSVLCHALAKINERDAYIVWIMMHTGQTLESILNRRKEDLKTSSHPSGTSYMHFEKNGEPIPPHITNEICKLSQNSAVYLFETAKGKKIRRTQVTRNLKKAGRDIGLNFDLTPKILHGYVCAYITADKRSELERGLGFSID